MSLIAARCQPFQASRHVGRSVALLHHHHSQRRCVHVYAGRAGPASKIDAARYNPTSARDAIEEGTRIFKENKDYTGAVRLFNLSMDMKPNDDEARAALYNLGCALTKLKQWEAASGAIVRAINEYNLKLSVALKDDDLKELRDRREWVEALTEVKGGLSRNAKIDLRSEAKAPFRFPRIIIFGSLAAGAGVGLIIITFRLIAAIQGAPGAPELQESIQNFGINSAALAVLLFLLNRDLQAKQRAVEVTEREEVLSRLQINLGNDRVLPLLKFRGQVRPVIVAGSRGFVDKAIREGEKYHTRLRERGVSVIPLVLDGLRSSDLDPDEKIRALKREFQRQDANAKGFGASPAKDSARKAGSETSSDAEGPVLVEGDKKWNLEPFAAQEWKEWMDVQRSFAKLPASEANCWVQIQLDGTVRSSGVGNPPWAKFVDDLPPLDSVRTTITDGIGPSI